MQLLATERVGNKETEAGMMTLQHVFLQESEKANDLIDFFFFKKKRRKRRGSLDSDIPFELKHELLNTHRNV